jgi:5-methylcytosine-specific restriction endonuclease McrA
MSVLSKSVLVLNTGWLPVNVTTVDDAVCKVYNEGDEFHSKGPRARFVDPETYATYDFESWVDTWEDAIRSSHFDADKVLESPCFAFRIPEVIVLTKYDGTGDCGRLQNKSPKFNRKNVYIRDHNTCQYCGKKCRTDQSNLDHVIPKSYKGQMSWTNIVVACIPCNDKKRNRTPKEAGMRLIRKPRIPKPGEIKIPWGMKLKRKLRGRVLPSWEHFLGKMYWEIRLKDD